MEAMQYETLIRRAFGFKAGRMLDRWGDPASLANTDQFMESNLPAVKVGAGYAFEILTNEIINRKHGSLGAEEMDRLEGFTERIVKATNLLEVSEIIDEFTKTVEDEYFRFEDGTMTLI